MQRSSKEQGIPALHWAPRAEALVLGRGVPITSGCEPQQGLHPGEMDSHWGPRSSSQVATHGLHSQTAHPGLQFRGSSSKDTKYIEET